MKKIAWVFLSLCFALPALSMASTACLPYKNNYDVTVKGHDGELVKTQTITDNTYRITSQITIKTFLGSKVINQSSNGTCNGSTITPQTFSTDQSGSTQTVSLDTNVFDPLSLVTSLSAMLINGNNIVPATPMTVWYNGAAVSVTCSTNAQLSDTKTSAVACATPDNSSLVLSYGFSTEGKATMLTSTATENGQLITSAVLQARQ